jgi:hypothetical protein
MPAYCGGQFKANLSPGDLCPSGEPATASPNGNNEPDAKSALGEASTVTGTVPWNVNTTPVKVGTAPSASYSGGIPGPEADREIPFNEATKIVNQIRGRGGDEYRDFVNMLQRYTGSKLGTVGGVDSAWATVLTDAYSAGVNAFDLLQSGPEFINKPSGGFGSGGSAYSGPREAVVVQAESDIRSLADDIAIEILGRGATDAELQKITNRIRKAEMAQPQVTTTQPGRTVTEQGLTATGREDILRDVLSQNPEFEQYQLDTTVMDAMTRFVNKKKAVAGD